MANARSEALNKVLNNLDPKERTVVSNTPFKTILDSFDNLKKFLYSDTSKENFKNAIGDQTMAKSILDKLSLLRVELSESESRAAEETGIPFGSKTAYLNERFDESFISGTESTVMFYVNDSNVQPVEAYGIFGMTISSAIDIKPVMTLGRKYVAGYTLGSRMVAGTMMFYAAIDSPFYQIQRLLQLSGSFRPYVQDIGSDFKFNPSEDNNHVNIEPELLPPIGVIIFSNQETPVKNNEDALYVRYKILEGVRITSFQEQKSIDSTTVNIYEYNARSIKTNLGKIENGGTLNISVESRMESTALSRLIHAKNYGGNANQDKG